MTASFPVRLLSRLVGWLGDVRESEAHSAQIAEMRARAEPWLRYDSNGRERNDAIGQLARDVIALTGSPGVVQKGERT